MKVTIIIFKPLVFNIGKFKFISSIDTQSKKIKIKIKDTSKPVFQKTVFKASKHFFVFTDRDSAYTKLEAKFVDALEQLEEIDESFKSEIVIAIRKYFMYNIHRI